MWSVKDPIVAEKIAVVRRLGGAQNPVYLLGGAYSTTDPSDSIVVKYERGVPNSDSLARNFSVVWSAAPGDRQRIVNGIELNEMLTWAQDERLRQQTLRRGQPTDPDLNGFLIDLQHTTNSPGAWIKMPYRNVLTLEEARLKLQSGDKFDVRQTAKSLGAPGGLESLGRVIAADLFNGSMDRFAYPGPGCRNPRTRLYFNHLANIGNVILVTEPNQQHLRVAALDTWDPNSPYKDVVAQPQQRIFSVAAQETNHAIGTNQPGEWPGRLLDPNRAADLRLFAAGVVDDLEAVLGPRNRKLPFASKRRLPQKAADRLVNGIVDGANDIKTRLCDWRTNKPNKLHFILADRMQVLNW